MADYIMALDQGTTSSRAIIFDSVGNIVATGQHRFRQIFPNPGWVEHDPFDILNSEYASMNEALEKSGLSAGQIAAIGITNQRETTLIWDRHTGQPVYNAIVWQCRRTADISDDLKARGLTEPIYQKTGLIVDAYFSGTKIKWILDHVDGARERAERGHLLFGTVESWLIWNLTGGKVHVSDVSNAARTMLFNINEMKWDPQLCEMLDIPMSMLPETVPNSRQYGVVSEDVKAVRAFAGIPICSAVGDQQAALFGQGCIFKGLAKNTYGTGCFTLMNIGNTPVRPGNGLVTTVAWQLGDTVTYALEGSVFNAGSTIQWLRDELGLIESAEECSRLAESVPDTGGVCLVSAFTGLGAPYWDMYARGAIVGLTRGTSKAQIARAALEGIAFQVKDLLDVMHEAGGGIPVLKVDGGASVSNVLLQFQADILRIPIDRPRLVETTALGAAFLAGLAAGVWEDAKEIIGLRSSDRIFYPEMPEEKAQKCCEKWKKAVQRAMDWEEA